jgi:hypothetical protein
MISEKRSNLTYILFLIVLFSDSEKIFHKVRVFSFCLQTEKIHIFHNYVIFILFFYVKSPILFSSFTIHSPLDIILKYFIERFMTNSLGCRFKNKF